MIGEKIKLKTTITDYKIERKTVEYSVYTWWLRFLRFVFRREWAKLKDDILDTVSLYATAEIHNEINNYFNYIDEEIVNLIKIADYPKVKLKYDFDLPDLAPEPRIINGIAYPKRIIKIKEKHE